MTPAETLDRHAREADRLAHDWPAWRDRPIPDGQLRAARTDGMPRSGDVADPVGETVVRRDGMLVKDGVNLERQVDTIAGHLLELTLAMATNAIGHAPASRPELTTGLRLSMAAVALTTVAQNARAWDGCVYDGGELNATESIGIVASYLARLRVIIPATKVEATWAKEELCHGNKGTAYACDHDHDTKPVPAVKDGLCTAGYHRRYRAERKEDAA